MPRRRALSLHLRKRPGALLLAAARLSRRPARDLYARRPAPRIPHRKILRPALHGVVRASGFDLRWLESPAESRGGQARTDPLFRRRARADQVAVGRA